MTTPDPSLIDAEAIENLRSLGEPGDDTFLREIVGIFLEDLPLRLEALETALATGDQALYTRSAHTVKGSSANVGAREVREIAMRLERRSKAEPLANLEGDRAELIAAAARARAALLALIAA